ncbi:hypothetical protein A1O7_02639 [Cladophialophora yegresii CBS 114405]|uniref:Transcription factor domain-containing protein n=1 Tax=Cladophialophora yegresii CBS 114405 TaxID=1182544 RepID=W9WCB9_9EURO|nr:uncharacterized protein A1O7_02639 [Cladophialophora yegresii CBS 114405]EXJ62206.1 hypothetical protein A1O7_02639 [Cladophialophora yegresii CBS 114405]
MLQFTTPQSGDPRKNKSAIAFQVRQHAAKVAAARHRKTWMSRRPPSINDGAAAPLESCFLLSLDSDTEKSRQTSADVVKKANEGADRSGRARTSRPRWTSVYRVDMPKQATSKSTPKTSPSATRSPSTEPSSSEIDLHASSGLGSRFDYTNALPWPKSLDSFLDAALGSAQSATASSLVVEDDSGTYHSLLTSGRHIPDVQASLLAFVLGSGFGGLTALPPLLKQAQRRAVSVTVALDQYQRESIGAPLLEDIVGEAEHSYMAFQTIEIAFPAATTGEILVVDCCRLAGLVYCELVLFPSLSEGDIMFRLVSDLQVALETAYFWLSGEERLTSVSNMLLWATALGAMAATTATARRWFVRRLSVRLCADERLCVWQVFRSLMSTFLWWRPVCDHPGQMVWEEAIHDIQLAICNE